MYGPSPFAVGPNQTDGGQSLKFDFGTQGTKMVWSVTNPGNSISCFTATNIHMVWFPRHGDMKTLLKKRVTGHAKC
jgi:hypothetical protein